MKKLFSTLFLCSAFALMLAACSKDNATRTPAQPQQGGGTTTQPNTPNNNTTMTQKMLITVGGTRFNATLVDNPRAKAFAALLPQTFTMNEHAGNEKFYNLPRPLPTDEMLPGTIQTGDLLLWGNNCVVLFYQTFSSSYRYTRIGKVDEPRLHWLRS